MSEIPVTVLLPVYNCERYLAQAIRTVLNQSFKDFELLIINDGSTDSSEAIIGSFGDPRIRYLKNETNQGLVNTLNRGLAAAAGKYIARMDGDDLMNENRLRLQLDFLLENPSFALVASTVELINEAGDFTGYWEQDKNNLTPGAIHRNLPKYNCIGHPTIMARSEILKKFSYLASQKLAEDYDLWLRMAAEGYQIAKLNQPLVQHRILGNSFTRTRKYNFLTRIGFVQVRFFYHQLIKGRLNYFVFKTLFFGGLNILKGGLQLLK